jgi:hypothetical protein
MQLNFNITSMNKLLLGFTLFAAANGFAQNPDLIRKYSAFIDSSDLRKHLTVLASDEYEGRETGKKGQELSAAYIQQSFREDGCAFAPGMNEYQQYFEVIETTPGGELSFGGKTLKFKTDFVYFGAKRQVKLEDLPVFTQANIPHAGLNEVTVNCAVIYPLKGMDVRAELSEIRKNLPKNAKAIILVTTKYNDLYESLEHYATTRSMRLKDQEAKEETPIIVVRAEALSGVIKKPFTYLLGKGTEEKLKKIKSVTSLTASLNTDGPVLKSSNVLGYISGSDPVLSKEVIVITAHYDHIGIENGVVYNGADDDGTGTVALLEIAEAFMTAKKEGNGPKRSILIMTVSGEEKGLLGSSYYVNHPIIPLERTITDLNIDMIGRNDIAHQNSDYIYIIGSDMLSRDLHNANEAANKEFTKLQLDYKFNNASDPNQFYYRSDHYNFAKNNIPSIFYFSGIHEDYHQPGDDIEKINFTKVETVARLVFSTAWMLADGKDRPRVDF